MVAPSLGSDTTRAWLVVGGVYLGLNLLLRIPDVLFEQYPLALDFYLSDPSRLYYFFSLDLFCLLSLLVFLPLERTRAWVYWALTGAILALLVYRTYDAVVVSMLHRSPIFYADASHVVGALYLLLNASVPWSHFVGVVGAGAGLGVLAWKLPSLLRMVHRLIQRLEFRRGVIVIHLALWPLVGVAAATDQGIDRRTYQDVCLSTVECVFYNVQASVDLRREANRRWQQSPDTTYVQYRDLSWANPPSLYLVMVESYGTALANNAVLGAPYDQFMARVADSLRTAGWHSATALSEAPVFGGLSWLSVATVLLGTPVAHQPSYDVLRAELPRYPHLVRLLREQGYRTATLQPPVRSRPGLQVENPYRFDQTFYLRDLDYQGPDYGWGIVPDQYSLAVAHERFVERTTEPFFLFFETVTSHATWDRSPPPFVNDPAVLNRPTEEISPGSIVAGSLPQRGETTYSPPGTQAERLFRHIRYDWRVLVQYLRTKAPRNSLVVVVGDHQPYFADGRSPATPLHVLSHDPSLVRRFEAYGLRAGLQLRPAADTLRHASLYSLIVRVLAAHDRSAQEKDTGPLPPFRPEGVERSALVNSQSSSIRFEP